MSKKLKERIDDYQLITDCKILPRIPIVICINGRGFSKTTQLIDKPFCNIFSECMLTTALQLCSNIEGVLFAYQHNDEIILITRNDQNNDTDPWYDNKVQKLCSATSSIATLFFNKIAQSKQLNLTGDAIFLSQVFGVPTQAEAINTIIYHQQQNFYTAVQSACLYNLLNKYDNNSIRDLLAGLDIDGKIDLLSQECGINFNDYPMAFKRGAAIYKVPKIVDGVMKNKWFVNSELPIFTRDQSFLSNIFRMGTDIYRG